MQLMDETISSYDEIIEGIEDQFKSLINEHNPSVIKLSMELCESKKRLKTLKKQKSKFVKALTTIKDAASYHREAPNG